MEMILMELRKKYAKEKSIRNKILLEKALNALQEYQQLTQDSF